MRTSSASPNRFCVILFDIDGTLLTGPEPVGSPSPGVRAMDASARQLTGLDGLYRQVEFAGRTDRQIARDLLRVGGTAHPTEQEVDKLIELYLQGLEEGVKHRPYRAFADSRKAVEAFRWAGAIIGLGTGNIAKGAMIKLQSAGLADLFDQDLGGYGDDGHDREELLRMGAKRCDPEGRLPVVVVGDTPYDVLGAHAIHAFAVAVATGHHTIDALQKTKPHLVFDRLDEGIVEPVMNLLGSNP